MINRARIFVLVTAVFTLILSACGGGEPPPAVTFDIKGQDSFRYDPETLSVASGVNVTINFENTGALEHSWVLISNSVDPVDADESDALAGASTGVLSGGTSKTITFSAPPAGTYTFVCTVPGHAAGGKIGILTVTP